MLEIWTYLTQQRQQRPAGRGATNAAPNAAGALIEPLERRQLLSAVVAATAPTASTAGSTVVSPADVLIKPNAVYLHRSASPSASTTTSTTVQGYTPADIAKAYGIDQVSFNNGAIKGDGAGETIAIVDAYNDPNITADLGVFDSQFSLPAADLKVVNQTGGSKLPTTDSGWAGEISLDVEWAHAAAPGARILLVEAADDSLDNLIAGVDYARHAAGVSVVSMSWGGSEFFGFNGSEFTSETQYDQYFTTPAGHQGVTFVASAGDSGPQSGVQWPAVSPNVVSVGGTSLGLASDGTYLGESSWNGTNGGFSQVESQPSYQNVVQSTGVRSVPDVSYDGDPNTGFAVYDSLPDQGYSGWQQVGGTSAGAPQWAALVAIADQGRALSGQGALDGPTQTLPLLYATYSSATTASGSTVYASAFNDVVDSGGGGRFRWRWGGFGGYNPYAASPGYDAISGLGTPKAAFLIDSLAGISPSTSGTGTSTGSPTPTSTGSGTDTGSGSSPTSSPTPTPQQLPASPVSAVFTKSPSGDVLGGQSGTVRVQLTNTSGTDFSGPIAVDLYASTDGSVPAGATPLAALITRSLKLHAGKSKTVKLTFTWPTSGLDTGSYHLVASVSATDTNTAPSTPTTSVTVSYTQPTVDLATSFGSATAVSVIPGVAGSVLVTIQNLGNVTASGTLSLQLYASLTPNLDPSIDQPFASTAPAKIAIKAGRSRTFRIHFVAPTDGMPGTYYLIALPVANTTVADSNSSNDAAVIPTQ